MKKTCHYDHLIDEYLLDKLKPEDQAEPSRSTTSSARTASPSSTRRARSSRS
ncbi:MAG: hypothetical protein MZV70_71120 [Desulfobacterales bacterium]|nr:hypothetical protein [Desulfobacterales bacterium]